MTGQLPLFNDTQSEPRPVEVGEQALEVIPLDKDRATSVVELTPVDGQFAFTKNYNISGGLVGRLLRALDEKMEVAGATIGRDTFASDLTIPTQRVDGLFNFIRKGDMVTAKNQLTPFGQLILQKDPYLLNLGLLWFLHYMMASNARLVIWNRLFDHIFYQGDEVAPSESLSYFTDVKANMTDKVFQKNGRNEIGAILRTYADDLFKPLGLIMRIDIGRYTILTDEFAISPYILLASLLTYRDRYYPGAATLEIPLLVDAHFSPGRLFRQKDAWVRRALDSLHGRGLLAVETRLGLDQVRFKSNFTWLSAVASHFQEAR